MDKSNSITRRAALVGAAVSSVALAVPAVAAVKPATIEALAEKFHADASALDPRISQCWLGYDELASGPREMRLASIHLGRAGRSAAPVETRPAVSDLFAEWQAVCARVSASRTDDEANVHMRAYWRLQRRIGAMRPATAREAAMQFMVETDDGESDYRNAFYRRVRKLALGV